MRTLILIVSTLIVTGTATGANGLPAPKVLIITGDHDNNWKSTTGALKEILVAASLKVDVTEQPRLDLTSSKLAAYDALILNYKSTEAGGRTNPKSVWADENKKAFANAVKAGAGLVVVHGALSAFTGDSSWAREFEKLCAGGRRPKRSRRKLHDLNLTVQRDHPITRGLSKLRQGRDELFQNLRIAEGSQVLVTAFDGKEMDEPVVWVNRYGKGRVVQLALGRDVAAMQGKGFQTLLDRCVNWAGEKGFRVIFDGKTLKGWEGNNRYWRVRNGAIVGGSLTRPMPFHNFLCSVEQFEDFELRLEAKVVGQRNSGVCVRSRRQPMGTTQRVVGYEVDMGVFRWGWVYEEGGSRRLLNAADQKTLQPKIQKVLRQGKFNDFVIRCEGRRIRAWLNGVPFEYREKSDRFAREMRKGVVGLQLHNGRAQEVSFRNIRVKVLPTKR